MANRDIPLSVIADWPYPNYTDPHTRGPALLIVNSVFISLVLVAVSLRLYTRVIVKRWFGSDDVFIILALISTIGLTVTVILANQKFGWDRHIYDIPGNLVTSTLKVAFIAKLMFTLAATFTRISLLCFCYRLVRDSDIVWFRTAIHLSLAFVVAVCVGFVFLTVFICVPVSAYWAFPPIQGGKCISEGKATLAAGIINCFADFLCTVLPMPLVARLKMPPQQRISVVVLFSVGFLVTIAGVIRTYFIWKSLLQSYDETWFAYPLWIAAAVEIDLGVICASAPALRPLFIALSAKVNSKDATPGSTTKASSRTLPKGYKRFPPEMPSALVITRTQEFELNDWDGQTERELDACVKIDKHYDRRENRHEEWPIVSQHARRDDEDTQLVEREDERGWERQPHVSTTVLIRGPEA